MPDVDMLLESYAERSSSWDSYSGPSSHDESSADTARAKQTLGMIDYRRLWNEAHREHLRQQEAGQASVLCEVLGEMVARTALLTHLRLEWGWSDELWRRVTAELPPPAGATEFRCVGGADGPRYANVSCSQCGSDFGPGDEGFSSCADHFKKQDAKDEEAAFDRWLKFHRPAGDHEAVQRKWHESSDYRELHATPRGQRS